MRLLILFAGLLLAASSVSKKTYPEASCNLEQLNREGHTARKALRLTEQNMAQVRDSQKHLDSHTLLSSREPLQPKLSDTDTNSAAHASWMSVYDREVLYWLNVARLNPPGFFDRFVLQAYRSDPTNSYLSSLMKTMYTMKPVSALLPDKSLFDAAMCHARQSGASGYVGHARLSGQCRKIYSGECCSYGADSPLDVVIQLLDDEGVPDLGHRMLCLDEGFKKAGVATAPHTRYRTNTVIDFSE